MSLVSNFIGGISSSQIAGIVNGNDSFDLNNTTFSDLLKKQMEVKPTEGALNIMDFLGMPSGMQIKDFNPQEVQTQTVGETSEIDNSNQERTTSETVTFYNSLLNNDIENQTAHSGVFDFARRQAANLYNKYSRDVICDVQEFAEDLRQFSAK